MDRAWAGDPHGALTRIQVGLVWDEVSQHPPALAAYREAVRLDPEMELAQMMLAIALAREGRIADAEAAFAAAARSEPLVADHAALLRADMLRECQLRFSPQLALSGGEDALFFRQLKAAGYRSVWAAAARVFEPTPAHKASLGYLLREEFRRGNARIYVDALAGGQQVADGKRLRHGQPQLARHLRQCAPQRAAGIAPLADDQRRARRIGSAEARPRPGPLRR